MYSFQNLVNKIQSAQPIDFGDLFNNSLDLFKKVWIQGLLLQLFSILIMLPFIISFYLPYIDIILENSSNGQMDTIALSQALVDEYGTSLVWVYLLLLGVSVVSSLLYLGFYKNCKRNGSVEIPLLISDFFYFFKSSHFRQSSRGIISLYRNSILAALLCLFPLSLCSSSSNVYASSVCL